MIRGTRRLPGGALLVTLNVLSLCANDINSSAPPACLSELGSTFRYAILRLLIFKATVPLPGEMFDVPPAVSAPGGGGGGGGGSGDASDVGCAEGGALDSPVSLLILS